MSKQRKQDGVVYSRKDGKVCGFATGIAAGNTVESPARPRTGRRPTASFASVCKPGTAIC